MIGSGLVRYLNDRGIDDLFLVDSFSEEGEKWKNLVGKKFSDLIGIDKLFSFLEKNPPIDAILHMGACSDTTEKNFDYLLENNTHYTVRLARWAVSKNVRFIYASSAATYGDGSQGFSDGELESLKPLNPYGFSKHLADLWLKREGLLERIVGLKYFNVFGPNEEHKGKMASMIYKMTKKREKKEPIFLFKSNHPDFADGEQKRDFIYVKDAAKKACAFLDPKYRHIGGIFNIGSATPNSWNFLARSVFSALGEKEEICYIDMPKELEKQYQNFTVADMRKFQRVFQKDPHYLETLLVQDAIKDYVQNHLLAGQRW